MACGAVDERQDHLRFEPQAILGERGTHVGGDVDVGEAANDADVVFLEGLEAIAATVLGRLAGGLRFGERTAEIDFAAAERRDAEADRQPETRVDTDGVQARDALAQSFAEHRRLVDLRGHDHREAVAGNARGHGIRRQMLAQQVADLRDGLVAHVHAEVFVDDVQFVDVDVQQAPALTARLAFDEHELDALFERGARQQPRERVVTGLDAGGDAPRQQVGEMHVAADEFRCLELAEQREHARGASTALTQRAGEDAIGNRHLAGLRRDAVDDQRIAACLRDG